MPARRQKAGVPADMAYRSKNALALELVDEALARGLPPAPVLADSDYGDDYRWRAALRERGRGLLRGGRTPRQGVDEAPVGCPHPLPVGPRPKDPLPAPKRLDQIARELPARAWRKLTWREGTRGPMQGRFARVAIWASHGYTQRQHQGERAREWLLIEWPPDKEAPTDYWLAHLGAGTKTPTLKCLVGLARERWRVEQDYRELKEELGPRPLRGPLLAGLAPPRQSGVPGAPLLAERTRCPARRRGHAKKTGTKRPPARKPAANAPPSARRSRADVLRALSLVRQPAGHLLAT